MTALKNTNKNAAVIAAIRDYKNMQFIINNTPDAIKEVYEKMIAPRRAELTGLPSAQNRQAGSENLSSQIDSLDKMQERYTTAIEFIAWFEPAWSYLTDIERCFLSEFYTINNRKSGATYRLMKKYQYSERKVETMRSNALKHLRVLLYGQFLK